MLLTIVNLVAALLLFCRSRLFMPVCFGALVTYDIWWTRAFYQNCRSMFWPAVFITLIFAVRNTVYGIFKLVSLVAYWMYRN